MPIYEYHCPDCDTTFEQRRMFSQADDPLSCPQCESPNTERLLSRFMISVDRGNGSATAASMEGGGCPCGGTCACRA
ncbi:MAG: zinc ribbon domain-containing protein [Anaerolineae bacterium]